MLPTTKPFFALTAGDLMTHPLVMVPREMSLRTAAHLLSQSEVSGAPVIDENGRCVGVLSATDFMHWAEGEKASHRGDALMTATICSEWQVMDVEMLPMDEVSEYMTHDPVTVQTTVSVGELARLMLDAHIHRLIVVDNQHKPIGIVSSTDIIAAVAHAKGR